MRIFRLFVGHSAMCIAAFGCSSLCSCPNELIQGSTVLYIRGGLCIREMTPRERRKCRKVLLLSYSILCSTHIFLRSYRFAPACDALEVKELATCDLHQSTIMYTLKMPQV